MDDESDDFPIGIVDGKPVLASEDYDDILEDSDVIDKLRDCFYAVGQEAAPKPYGKYSGGDAESFKMGDYCKNCGYRAGSHQKNTFNCPLNGPGSGFNPDRRFEKRSDDSLADLLERARSGVREQTGDGFLRSVLDVSMRDGQAERIAGAWALYNRPGTPGEKAAAEAALRRMGIDPSKGQAGAYAPAGKTYSSSGSSYSSSTSGTTGPSQAQQKREYFKNRWIVVLEYTVVNDAGKTVTTKMAETVTATSETEARQAGVQAAMSTWKMLTRGKPTPTFTVVQCKRA